MGQYSMPAKSLPDTKKAAAPLGAAALSPLFSLKLLTD
jgi:hypothetical protein